MNFVAALYVMVALVLLGPELASGAGLGTYKAWEYVFQGAEATALWAVGVVYFARRSQARWARLGVAVSVYAAAEAALRPACRLMLDMHSAPNAPNGLCSSAGFDLAWLCPIALSGIAWAFASSVRGKSL